MAQVRSDRLAGPLPLAAGGDGSVGPVPSGETWIVKSIRVATLSAIIGGQWNATYFPASGPSGRFTGIREIGSNEDQTDEMWFVLDPGAELSFNNLSVSGTIVFTVFGAKLLGAA